MLLHIKQRNNKDLLYSTGTYIQYLIVTYNGKESEKEYIYSATSVKYCPVAPLISAFPLRPGDIKPLKATLLSSAIIILCLPQVSISSACQFLNQVRSLNRSLNSYTSPSPSFWSLILSFLLHLPLICHQDV